MWLLYRDCAQRFEQVEGRGLRTAGKELRFGPEIETSKEEREKEIMLDNLHYNIKKAIYISKGYGKRGINGKQLKSIQDSYFYATGCELSEERVNYLKTITDKQAEQVIIVLNKFHRYLRLQQSTSPVTNA